MRVEKLENMFRGWFVGNFDPSVLKTNDVEIAIQNYEANETEAPHVHKIAKEITVVLDGEFILNDRHFKEGDILILEENEPMLNFKTLTKVRTVVVKYPGVNDDKHPL
jgi:hypothetical protein